MARPPLVAVCGAGSAVTDEDVHAAEAVGRLLAFRGATVVCGGLGGVMAAAARGVQAGGGVSVGLLPDWNPDEAAAEISIALPTGMGEMRNALIVRACRGMIAIGGGYGTLTEVALALRLGRPVAALASWEVRRAHADEPDPAIYKATGPEDAVDWILGRIGGGMR